jgi:hypothetical protein
MVGYLRDARLGAAVYNLGHTYALPAAMSLLGLAGHHPLTVALGLVWLGHIGMDRLAGYGLKYDTDFQHTHLGQPGARRRTRPAPAGPGRSRSEGFSGTGGIIAWDGGLSLVLTAAYVCCRGWTAWSPGDRGSRS